MKRERRFVGAAFVIVALLVIGLTIATYVFGWEGCSDWDTVRVGNKTTQVCDDD